jgi:hypothetical protein
MRAREASTLAAMTRWILVVACCLSVVVFAQKKKAAPAKVMDPWEDGVARGSMGVTATIEKGAPDVNFRASAGTKIPGF